MHDSSYTASVNFTRKNPQRPFSAAATMSNTPRVSRWTSEVAQQLPPRPQSSFARGSGVPPLQLPSTTPRGPARSNVTATRMHGKWTPRSSVNMPSWAAESQTSAADSLLATRTTARPATASARLSVPRESAATSFRVREPQLLAPPSEWGAPVHLSKKQQAETPRAGAQLRRVQRAPTANEHSIANPRVAPGSARGATNPADFRMLAAACRRAGRRHEEAVAHYCRGVLFENAELLSHAKDAYTRMSVAAEAAGHAPTLAIACNHLGVVLQRLGDNDAALDAHTRHVELTDIDGDIVALLNCALVLSALGRHEEAAEMNKRALRAAVRTSSLTAESVVCANMAFAGEHSGELESARLCMHRHQQLVSSLRDRRAEGDAQLALGELEATAGNLKKAGDHFHHAMEIAAERGEEKRVNQSKVQLGITQGALDFEEWLSKSLQLNKC